MKLYPHDRKAQENCHDELLAALSLVVDFIPDGWAVPLGWNQIMAQAREAIAKDESLNTQKSRQAKK
jgi:hypothetical protein